MQVARRFASVSHKERELLAQFRNGVLSWVRSRIRHREDAEDIVQQSFEAALQQGTAVLHIGAYAMGTARNLVAKYFGARTHRHAHEELRVETEPTIDGIEGQAENARNRHLQETRLETLEQALANLPSKWREIVQLRKLEGVPVSEAAQRMNMSYATFEKERAKALAQLTAEVMRNEPTSGEAEPGEDL